jgi:hypothetical protein
MYILTLERKYTTPYNFDTKFLDPKETYFPV